MKPLASKESLQVLPVFHKKIITVGVITGHNRFLEQANCVEVIHYSNSKLGDLK